MVDSAAATPGSRLRIDIDAYNLRLIGNDARALAFADRDPGTRWLFHAEGSGFRVAQCCLSGRDSGRGTMFRPRGNRYIAPQLGPVTIPPVLDIEYPSDQPQCGAQQTFDESLMFAGGTLVITVTAPYLCLYETGITKRTFVVESGTGRFADTRGSGTIQFDTQSSRAVEDWQGSILSSP